MHEGMTYSFSSFCHLRADLWVVLGAQGPVKELASRYLPDLAPALQTIDLL